MSALELIVGRAVLTAAMVSLVLSGVSCRQNRPPQAPLISSPASGRPGDEFALTAMTADPNGDSVSYLIVWDGARRGQWTSMYPDGQRVTLATVCPGTGDHLLMVKARDWHEAESNWSAALAVRVGYSPPEVPSRPWCGSEWFVARSGVCSTRVSLATGHPVAFQFQWGDGRDSGWTSWQSDSLAARVSHTYLAAGEYNIRVRSKNDLMLISDWSEPLPVNVTAEKPPAQ